jgi:hypothetical protein
MEVKKLSLKIGNMKYLYYYQARGCVIIIVLFINVHNFRFDCINGIIIIISVIVINIVLLLFFVCMCTFFRARFVIGLWAVKFARKIN